MKTLCYLLAILTTCSLTAAEPEMRSPDVVAQELLAVYGKKLPNFAYIPTVALHSKLRFAKLTHNAKLREEVEALLPNPFPEMKGEIGNAGHLLLAAISRDEQSIHRKRCADYLLHVANRLKTSTGARPPSDTAMSDAVFMVPPILCEAGALSGQEDYFRAATMYLEGMVQLRMRDDGLYRHGHLCDTAWGRGNGFPAVGFAWCLSTLPREFNGYDPLLKTYQRHMSSLVKHQDANGFWHQVIDHPESYAEYSCTAMIGFAMQRGISQKWLAAEEYQPVVDKAWQAVCSHTQTDGKLIDVCEGTGTQPTLEAYLQRKALRGYDDRGGAMGLLFATERMADGK